ncbi:telomerase Cajal body protein 1 isoform X2 [Daktulosphaira vitifoliae]|nr:telomerase Cajal body protein 1 isoform X2 [Daktulosphaira vitifoliae]XP_050546405.1 telomerase Cajal body protein 1 isoform X2 [Daktulosphaira vitifoliae]XP_050546406.1 telomerase Cajal body protein 1 isoform X2 [Daktulosphaira vitifoliae]
MQSPYFKSLQCICTISDEFFAYDKEFQQCLKGCKWSPDGSSILTNSEDNILRIFNLEVDDLNQCIGLQKSLQLKEGGTIYDYLWCPNTSISHGNNSLILSTSNRSPIHLWNAKNGKLEATYRVYDHVDEVAHVNSLCFNWSGEEIYCGSLGKINIFYTDQPGRNFTEIPTKKDLHRSIISTIAMNPVDRSVFAVGTYSKDIGIYGGNQLMYILRGHKSGVTHVKFSPDGLRLYSGGRKGDDDIVCWDLRNVGQTLFSVKRTVTTNQRIYFDISSDGKFLVSGNSSGDIKTWKLDQIINTQEDVECVLPLNSSIQTHYDCVNGVSLHPYQPLVATASGQRHNNFICDDDENGEKSINFDSSLKIWKIN